MAKPAVPPQLHDPCVTALHAGAVVVTVVAGICALVALAAGSPLQFGSALAVFAAGWIAADFFQSAAGREPAVQRYAVPAERPRLRHESCRVVYAGGRERCSRSTSSTGQELAA